MNTPKPQNGFFLQGKIYFLFNASLISAMEVHNQSVGESAAGSSYLAKTPYLFLVRCGQAQWCYLFRVQPEIPVCLCSEVLPYIF